MVILGAINAWAQKDNPVPTVETPRSVSDTDQKGVFTSIEQMPEFPGGLPALRSFLISKLRYPEDAMDDNIQGTVRVRFIVNETGQVQNAEVIQHVNGSCDREALRVVRAMPDWKPGMHNGKAVKVFYTLPVTFRLAEDVDTTKPAQK